LRVAWSVVLLLIAKVRDAGGAFTFKMGDRLRSAARARRRCIVELDAVADCLAAKLMTLGLWRPLRVLWRC